MAWRLTAEERDRKTAMIRLKVLFRTISKYIVTQLNISTTLSTVTAYRMSLAAVLFLFKHQTPVVVVFIGLMLGSRDFRTVVWLFGNVGVYGGMLLLAYLILLLFVQEECMICCEKVCLTNVVVNTCHHQHRCCQTCIDSYLKAGGLFFAWDLCSLLALHSALMRANMLFL
jgi:hypothetical protein